MVTLKKLGGHFFVIGMIFFSFSCDKRLVSDADWQLVGSGFNFPEGPAWDAKETLYVSNCQGGWLAKTQSGQVDTFAVSSDTTFQKTNGLTIDPDGNIIACDFGNGSILQISPSGKASVLISGYQGERFHRPNDLKFDPKGNLYFTDPNSYDKEKTDGKLFYFDMITRDLILAADSLAFPNGIAISPIDGKLYFCESAKSQVVRFDRAEKGVLSNKEIFITLPGGDPDGIDFDVKGNLYVAHFGGGAIYIISPSGKILAKIATPGQKPTNLEFGDADLKTLFLTEVETNSLYKMRVKYPGFNSLLSN